MMKLLVTIENPKQDLDDYVSAIDNGFFVMDPDIVFTVELK